MKIKLLCALAVLAVLNSGCKKEGCTDENATNFDEKAKNDDGSCVFPAPEGTIASYAIWSVDADKKTVTMNGAIETGYLAKWNEMVAAYPDINQINIKECGGSGDDDMNIELCKKVYDQGVNIHIMDNGLVASGGTDFFLAGRKRTAGSNTEIGVHSWAEGNKEAKDFPADDQRHQKYIDLYKYYGRSEKWAKDFYNFTINAADKDNMYNLTDADRKSWEVLTE